MQTWLTPKEAADYLRVSKETIYRLARSKKIKSYKPSRKIVFKESDLDKYIEQGVNK
jgi:excisionase family DNA binding protein